MIRKLKIKLTLGWSKFFAALYSCFISCDLRSVLPLVSRTLIYLINFTFHNFWLTKFCSLLFVFIVAFIVHYCAECYMICELVCLSVCLIFTHVACVETACFNAFMRLDIWSVKFCPSSPKRLCWRREEPTITCMCPFRQNVKASESWHCQHGFYQLYI